MQLWAHRGGGKGPLENTMAGFELAIKHGFKAVEFDIMATKDGSLVLHHDFRLGRLSSTLPGSPHAADSYVDALSALELKDFQVNQSQLLHFKEFVYFLLANQLCANVELKARTPLSAVTLGRLTALLMDSLTHYELEAVRAHWVFSSFHHAALLPLTGFPKALLYEELPERWSIHADALDVQAVHLHWSGATHEAVRRIHATQRTVRVYTVNQAEEIQRLRCLGVEGVFTDEIEGIEKLLVNPIR